MVLLLSIPILHEGISLCKCLAIVLSLTGVFWFFFFSDSETDGAIQTTWFGYVLVVTSTVIYALFEVLYKVIANSMSEKEEREEVDHLKASVREISFHTQNIQNIQNTQNTQHKAHKTYQNTKHTPHI